MYYEFQKEILDFFKSRIENVETVKHTKMSVNACFLNNFLIDYKN